MLLVNCTNATERARESLHFPLPKPTTLRFGFPLECGQACYPVPLPASLRGVLRLLNWLPPSLDFVWGRRDGATEADAAGAG